MRIVIGLAALALATAGGASSAATTHPFKGSELAGTAKVSLATARHSALKARPGTITDQELEKERGGTGLRYSFDIRNRGKTFEVGIDAQTGAVLENKTEGRNAG